MVKAAIFGAAGQIGSPLSLLLKSVRIFITDSEMLNDDLKLVNRAICLQNYLFMTLSMPQAWQLI